MQSKFEEHWNPNCLGARLSSYALRKLYSRIGGREKSRISTRFLLAHSFPSMGHLQIVPMVR